MRKQTLSKLKRTLLVIGILTIGALSMTGCSKKTDVVETTSTAIETIDESKDFSIDLNEEEQKIVDELRNSDNLKMSESIADDGEVVYNESIPSREEQETVYTDDSINDIKTEWNAGDMSEERLRELIDGILIYSTQEERDELYNSLLEERANNEAKPAETQASKPAETKAASKPTKAAEKPTKASNTPAPTEAPAPTQAPEPTPEPAPAPTPAPEPAPQETEPQVSNQNDLPAGVYWDYIPGIGTVRSDDPRAAAYAGGGSTGEGNIKPEDVHWQ